jgi:DNA repair protein RadC
VKNATLRVSFDPHLLTPHKKEKSLQMTTTKPHYYGHRERLRKRFLNSGFEGLADYEIAEMVLTLAIPRRDVRSRPKFSSNALETFGESWMRPLMKLRKSME